MIRPGASRCIRAAATIFLALGASRVDAGRIAITVDDLPIYGSEWAVAPGMQLTEALLAGFARHRWRVTGFVNEQQLAGADHQQRVAVLRRWLEEGHDLGNHTYSHLSVNKVGAAAFEEDIGRGDAVTKALLADRGRREKWFRYPFLETGVTSAARDSTRQWLRVHGYEVAPVTMENSDWQFATIYDAAVVRGDKAHAALIREAYAAYSARVIHWYRLAGRQLLG